MENLSGNVNLMESNLSSTNNNLTEEELKKLNISARDEEKYPMPSKEEIEACGKFLWKTNLIASSLDINLQALMWSFYSNLNKYITAETDDAMPSVMIALYNLKNYLKESNNPMFKEDWKQ